MLVNWLPEMADGAEMTALEIRRCGQPACDEGGGDPIQVEGVLRGKSVYKKADPVREYLLRGCV